MTRKCIKQTRGLAGGHQGCGGSQARTLAGLLPLLLSGCLNWGSIDLAPKYSEKPFVLPEKYRGNGVFVVAKPSDDAVRKDWWKVFDDPVLNRLEEQAMAGNPDLHAAAERFLQARDEMMKARSKFVPHLGGSGGGTDARQSAETLFRSPASPINDSDIVLAGMSGWEPDFWAARRNATRAQIARAEGMAAAYALARLSLQAELAADYFTLRELDAKNAIFVQSIDYFKRSLALVQTRFQGRIASRVDVTRATYQLANTQARYVDVRMKRQVVEHAIAALVNQAPASFSIAPRETLGNIHSSVPVGVPSKLLQRRPDVAASERKMAEANRVIGIARAAFYPNISIGGAAGAEGALTRLFKVANGFWSYGSFADIPAFQGGFRRAQLQQTWSKYRQTEDEYRSTVLNAFREVENGLSQTSLLSEKVVRQNAAVSAAQETQDLSMELFRGGLASSLELIMSQVNTLESKLVAIETKAELLRASSQLIRSLGGGWSRDELPKDDDIQPFDLFQYAKLKKPPVAGGIDVNADEARRSDRRNLTKPVSTSAKPQKTDQPTTHSS